ncbi:RDD family protein [Microbulbifer rhizosphaerae]|uniref:Putative RDD family membrane protein YckC n=1 Tax=Microbulbifer rhizosphaerae TaxID=1562603 RepID=A0A7W4ZB09_9GAMM|nr:RDD family protein [Microbulbifer rhizosphaerae]MBB3063387.1 putative RDD family membrane protein YckC [Microbulbifer rhizosphaerae]
MDPWALLGIEPSDDARAIKRAYAKKLKQTRPDEKPQEFQQLHSAYKRALTIAERPQPMMESPQPVIESPQPVIESPQPIIENPQPVVERPQPAMETQQPSPQEETAVAEREAPPELPPEQDSAAAETERQKRIDEYRQVLEQVDRALESDRLIGMEETWRFLAECSYLLEEEFNWNLGLGVFERFARFNSEAPEKGSQVAANILVHGDMLFGWSESRGYLYREFGEALCNAVFDVMEGDLQSVDPLQGVRGGRKLVEQKPRPAEESLDYYYFGNLLGRAFALLLDVFLVYVVVGLTTSVVMIKAMGKSEGDASFTALSVSILGYLVLAWIAEGSRWQATPAKYLLGYRVTDRHFKRVGYPHGLWRIFSFMFTLPLFKIGWFINCFLGGNLLHDRLSRTYVIDYRKSREEYLKGNGGQ